MKKCLMLVTLQALTTQKLPFDLSLLQLNTSQLQAATTNKLSFCASIDIGQTSACVFKAMMEGTNHAEIK